MNPFSRLLRRSVPTLIRFACILALCALVIICVPILFPRPLPVILAMSAGHAVGGAAFACYLLAVILDSTGRAPPPDSLRPARSSEKPSASSEANTAR